MKTATIIKEKLQWFQVLSSFYEVAAPYMEIFIGIKCQALEKRTIETDLIEENAYVLRQLLSLIKNLPQPPDEELSRIKKHFETALLNCINGSGALVKYIQFDANSNESQLELDNLVNAIVLAREYIESIYIRLHLLPEKSDN
jgi:hypothetical protein